ncbi:hypothetical protein SAY86_002698 [Trapa natans]|uniref:Uncharacterized protein n=1 Tax=Trapa natans TaxID=22666 RepID=A0AAN7LJM5_TRANT|nr:hypothetical protein SAY86_002698 [Trapa natans]
MGEELAPGVRGEVKQELLEVLSNHMMRFSFIRIRICIFIPSRFLIREKIGWMTPIQIPEPAQRKDSGCEADGSADGSNQDHEDQDSDPDESCSELYSPIMDLNACRCRRV